MGLPVEVLKKRKKRKPVGRRVSKKWAEWLQTNRIELNAMSTPEFIAWLDSKIAQYSQGKVIPPPDVMIEFLNQSLRQQLEDSIRERILREAGLVEKVQAAMARLESDVHSRADGLGDLVRKSVTENPTDSWRSPIEQLAAKIAGSLA